LEKSAVKNITVQAIIIRASGSQEDLNIISSWESCSNKTIIEEKKP